MPDTRFDRVVAAFGSQVELARAIGVSPGRVAQWRRRGIPAERCFEIEQQSRAIAAKRGDPALVVLCEELRPDLDWAVVRENPLPRTAARQRERS